MTSSVRNDVKLTNTVPMGHIVGMPIVFKNIVITHNPSYSWTLPKSILINFSTDGTN